MILAMVLSMAFFFVYYTWIAPPPARPVAAPTVAADTLPTVPSTSSTPVAQLVQGNVPVPGFKETTQDVPVVLENDWVKATFSTQKASLIGWELKQYHQDVSNKSALLDLLFGPARGEALSLSLHEISGQEGTYSVETMDPVAKTITFLNKENGLEVRKMFALSTLETPYAVDVNVQVTNRGTQSANLTPRLWVSRGQKTITSKQKGFLKMLNRPDLFLPIAFVDAKVKHNENWDKLEPMLMEKGNIFWNGVNDRYFLMSLISREESPSISSTYGKTGDDRIYASLTYGALVLGAGESVQKHYSAYLGPKKREELQKLNVSLERSVDYGMLSFLALPLLWLMTFFHQFLKNWGLAIIALTFFVKMLLHPVNKKSMQSMKAMQKLQPKMAELRAKFKDNKEKLNTEIMMLFKSNKVNPMSGCLPMVLQMPVYFALYKVLWNAIELYHAPFFWFYRDLAAPDPYMITPILLALVMVAQQKLTPQSAAIDPAQQKMMTFMPLMFSVFMIFLPVGLILYILVNMGVSVAQQYMVHRDISVWDLLKKKMA